MKTCFLLIFSLLLMCVNVNAWVGIINHNSKTNIKHDGHCYTDSNNIGALKVDEERRIEGQCVMARCLENKDISLFGCGVVGVAPPCYVAEGDLSKPYPDCCFEIKCPENKANEEEDKLNAI